MWTNRYCLFCWSFSAFHFCLLVCWAFAYALFTVFAHRGCSRPRLRTCILVSIHFLFASWSRHHRMMNYIRPVLTFVETNRYCLFSDLLFMGPLLLLRRCALHQYWLLLPENSYLVLQRLSVGLPNHLYFFGTFIAMIHVYVTILASLGLFRIYLYINRYRKQRRTLFL